MKKIFIVLIIFFSISVFFINCAKDRNNPLDPKANNYVASSTTTSDIVGTWDNNSYKETLLIFNSDLTYLVKTNNINFEKGNYKVADNCFFKYITHKWNNGTWNAVSNPTNLKIYYYIYNKDKLFLGIYKRTSGSTGIVGTWNNEVKYWTGSESSPTWQTVTENIYYFTATSNNFTMKTNGAVEITMGYNLYDYSANPLMRKEQIWGGVFTNWSTNNVYILDNDYMIETSSKSETLDSQAYIRQ